MAVFVLIKYFTGYKTIVFVLIFKMVLIKMLFFILVNCFLNNKTHI